MAEEVKEYSQKDWKESSGKEWTPKVNIWKGYFTDPQGPFVWLYWFVLFGIFSAIVGVIVGFLLWFYSF